MGWKRIKDHYQISLVVQADSLGAIYVGTQLTLDYLVIRPNGTLAKRFEEDTLLGSSATKEELVRIQSEIDTDPATLQRLATTPDEFTKFVSVYTWEAGHVIEEFCEKPGWPNVTHGGRLMYDNRYHEDKLVVLNWAMESAKKQVTFSGKEIIRLTNALKMEALLQQGAEENLIKLECQLRLHEQSLINTLSKEEKTHGT